MTRTNREVVEYTGSLLTSEVKRHRAWLVLGWGTAREHPQVLSAFPCPSFKIYTIRQHRYRKASYQKRSRAKNIVHFSICACHPCAGAMRPFQADHPILCSSDNSFNPFFPSVRSVPSGPFASESNRQARSTRNPTWNDTEKISMALAQG